MGTPIFIANDILAERLNPHTGLDQIFNPPVIIYLFPAQLHDQQPFLLRRNISFKDIELQVIIPD
jgi:hypothetical protein